MNPEKKVTYLNLNSILPNRFQPRIKFNDDAIAELALSIKEHGVLQPIIVRPLSDKFEIIAGERRYKASIMAGLATIPAIIENLNDQQSAEIALIENVQRQDLTPIEKAISYKKILDMGYLTQEQLALKIGKSQSAIANLLRLLNLPEEVQDALLESKISERHARSLLKLKEKKMQTDMLKRVIEERLTVRALDSEIEKELSNEKEITIPDLDALFGKKEEIMQDNNFSIENLNIPVAPIVNDETNSLGIDKVEEIAPNVISTIDLVEEKIPEVDSIVDSYDSDIDASNPGFMDINKIEEKADNIYDVKPQANIEQLLHVDSVLPISEKETTLVENQVPEANLLENISSHQTIPVISESETDSDSSGGRFLNFQAPADIDIEEIKDPFAPINQAKPVDQSLSSSVDNLKSFDNLFNTINASASAITQEATPYEKLVDDIIETPQPVEEPEPIATSIISSDVDAKIENTEEPEIVDENPVIDNRQMPADQPPIIMPKAETEIDLRSIFSAKTEAPNQVDLKVVISDIRKLADKIESYGYNIDLDEVDFDDSYQVTIKIDKKN